MPEVKMHECNETTFSVHFCDIELWTDAPLVFKGDGLIGKMMQDDRDRQYDRRVVRTPGKEVLDTLFGSGFEAPKAIVALRDVRCVVRAHELRAAMEAVAEKIGITTPYF